MHLKENLRLLLALLFYTIKHGPGSAISKMRYRKWRFREIRRRFHARTKDESHSIIHYIPVEDEYGISHLHLRPSDVVLDIGSHIGVVSFMTHIMGSRQIHAFEADPTNYNLSKKYLSGLSGIEITHGAVGRSDLAASTPVRHSGYIGDNTGGGNVIMNGQPFEFYRQEITPHLSSSTDEAIPMISLDAILKPFPTVKLMKIDCEGSEFPILLTSKLIGRVQTIVGEYHEVEPEMMPRLHPNAVVGNHMSYHKELLADALRKHGFSITFKESARCLGLFTATRSAGTRDI